MYNLPNDWKHNVDVLQNWMLVQRMPNDRKNFNDLPKDWQNLLEM